VPELKGLRKALPQKGIRLVNPPLHVIHEGVVMQLLSWALSFFIIAAVAAVMGFGYADIAGAAAEIAKILFVVFVVLFLVTLVAGLVRRP
jgi:uncharacterized membrane protein YtjA (UPF0391 family)